METGPVMCQLSRLVNGSLPQRDGLSLSRRMKGQAVLPQLLDLALTEYLSYSFVRTTFPPLSLPRPRSTTVPIGPVVGGVVAGVVIVLLIGGTWWYCHAKAEREAEERRERRRRKRALAAAKNGGRPALSTATSAASLVSMNKAGARTHGGGGKGGEDEKAPPPVPPLPSAYALSANGGYPQQQQQPQQHSRQRSQGQQGYKQQQDPYYASGSSGGSSSYDAYAQQSVSSSPQDPYAQQTQRGGGGGYNDPPQSFFNACGNQTNEGGVSPDATSPTRENNAPTRSSSSSSSSSSPSKAKRKSRFRQAETSAPADGGDATRRYQPSRPSPLAAAAPIVRAEERKPEDVPKWGTKPFKRASEDGPLSPTSASRLQAIGQQQQQHHQQHPQQSNGDYAPEETLRSTQGQDQQQDARVTSGQWGVAYTADEPVHHLKQQQQGDPYTAYASQPGREQVAEDPYARPPSATKGPSPTGQRKVTPGYPHFTLDDGDDQDAEGTPYDMSRVRDQAAAAMRHRSTGEQSEDSFQYDSPLFYPSLAGQAQAPGTNGAEVLSDPPPSQGVAGRQPVVQRDVYSYGSPRRSLNGRG